MQLPSPTPVIQLLNVTRRYEVGTLSLTVLKGINLEIKRGEFVAIVGRSGSGKSTLMQILGLLDRPTSGQYLLHGRDVSGLSDAESAELRSRTVGFIFQMFNLLPRTSALANVILPMIYSRRPGREERAKQLLSSVGLETRFDHTPNQLSGGQQQRVAIARALANDPQILFADEPTGNLSSQQAAEILEQLRALNEQGVTVILVTHDEDVAARAKRVIHIRDGQIVSDKIQPATHADRLPELPATPRAQTAPAPKLRDAAAVIPEVAEDLRSAFDAIFAHKTRSALSILGITIGIAAVIAMMAIGRGAQDAIQARIRSLGSNVVMLFPGAPNLRGVRGAVAASSRMTLEDAAAVRGCSPSIADMYPEVEDDLQITYQDRNTKAELQGVTPNYESIRNATPPVGRFFTAREDLQRSRVVLLGQSVVNDLFGEEDPVGKSVRINRVSFDVIGTLPVKGYGPGGGDQDAMVVIPLHTAMARVLGTPYLHEMAIQCESAEAIPDVMAAIRDLIRKRHHLPSFEQDDFTIRNNADVQSALSGATATFSLLLLMIAGISLVIGGVGIMNILLVSVSERTREIGLRKALGASNRTVLTQFLLEAFALALVGGLLGTVVGASLALILSMVAGWPAPLSVVSIITALLFSAATGMLSGFWPAYKASLLSPIEALRYE